MSTRKKRHYPLWQQFVDRQDEWIGGILTDEDAGESTTIKSIHIDREDTYDAFRVEGDGWGCAFNVEFGGVVPSGMKNTIRFYAAGGMSFTITKP